MKFRGSLVFAFVLLLISSAASAQVVRAGTVEISPFAGYLFGGTFGGSGNQTLGDLDIDYFLGTMIWNFGHEHWVPFFSFGAGVAHLVPHVEPVHSTADTRFTMTLGGGVKYFFDRHFGMRFEGRYYGTSLPDNNNGCSSHDGHDHCHNNGWLSNGDLTGGLVIAF